jgi:ATP-dependent RNA helicase DHX37/DHR1
MAPPPKQIRYNAKARGSVAGGSSHKKRKRQSQAPPAGSISINSDGEQVEQGSEQSVIPDKEDTAVEEELPLGHGMGSKKRKRLESYIVCPLSDL